MYKLELVDGSVFKKESLYELKKVYKNDFYNVYFSNAGDSSKNQNFTSVWVEGLKRGLFDITVNTDEKTVQIDLYGLYHEDDTYIEASKADKVIENLIIAKETAKEIEKLL